MRHSIFTFLLVGTLISITSANPKPQEFSIGATASFGDAGYFQSALSPYGEWLELETGFYAWQPRRLHSGWRPYLHGHWSWTRFGWYWVSSEPFGWAVFHYGRWYYDDYHGWIWVPDRTWGPAWVEWRYDNDYVGWAPLPPYASFSINFGIRFTTHWSAPHRYWNFVRYLHMTSRSLYREVAPMDYTRRLMGTTRSTGRYEFDGDRVINRGVDRSIVERRGGFRRLDPVDVRETNSPRERQIRDRNRDRIETYKPDVRRQEQTPGRIEARRPERGTSLELQRIERTPREMNRATNPGGTDRERSAVKENTRPVDRTPQSPATAPQNDNFRRGERRIEQPRQESSPKIREQAEPKRDQKVTPSDRPLRQERREIAAPRTRTEQARPAPSTRQATPRGSEKARSEGGRKRN